MSSKNNTFKVNSKKHDHAGLKTHIHFSKGDKHYVASNNGHEKIIFNADENGNVTSWHGVYEGWTFEAIKYLFER